MNNKNTQQQTMMQPLVLDFKKVIRTRQLNFDKEFTREYIVDVCSALDKLMEFDKIMETPKEALKIKLDSPGGGGGGVCVLSHVQLFATPWTVAYQVPLSVEFSRR